MTQRPERVGQANERHEIETVVLVRFFCVLLSLNSSAKSLDLIYS